MSERPRVLVADDKESLRELLARVLADGYEVTVAEDGSRALALLRSESFDVVVSDIRMPGADGLEVLKAAHAVDPHLEVILMTGFATIKNAVDAIRAGAFDYLPKPFEHEDALMKVGRAVERKALRDRAMKLERALAERQGPAGSFEGIIGLSPAMERVLPLLEKAARSDLTVLIEGESGTGKELAARAIHRRGPRRLEPFVAVNCGALPVDLIESELFGHVRGAFSGATADKRGLFEEAGRGTVFLDEIGELPLALQVKLNRALQEHELRRVGDTRVRPLEARVIAATNRKLTEAVAAGHFREDLYFRLAVFPLRLPPLRQRKADIPLLAEHFLARARQRASGAGPLGLKPEALRALLGYRWPGNVRELQNVIERAAVVAEGELVEKRDLALTRKKMPTSRAEISKLTWAEFSTRVEQKLARRYFRALLDDARGNVAEAATRAGMARESLHRLLRKYRIDAAKHRR
jgi:DNA-binding NtrC family response regulator